MALFSESPKAPPAGGALAKPLPPALVKALLKVTELGAVPAVATRIAAVTDDPNGSVQDVLRIVKTDPALAARLLKVVNSAFYGLPSQVASLDRAVPMLGLSTVRNLALASSLLRLLRPGALGAHFQTRDIWTHSLAVALAARGLAKASHFPLADEVFVGGLVHDMGLLVACQIVPDQLAQVANESYQSGFNHVDLETRLIGADHQALGLALTTRWKFPPMTRSAIGYHHEPRSLQPELQRLAAYVYIADVLCCTAQYGYYLTARRQELSDEVLQMAELTRDQLPVVMEPLPDQLAEAEAVFQA